MIKRVNKLTALLVAATAVASMVPGITANAADYTKIASQEGTIYAAKAYKDGKFYVDGNVKDGTSEAAYYLNGGQYTQIDGIDSGATVTGTYGDKYVSVDDGSYYVDLSSGKVTDEKVAENAKDDAAMALKKNIKDKANDRYTTQYADLKTDLTELPGAEFGATWYATTYDGKNVYTDAKGNYIDADYNLGKIKVEFDNSSKTVNITNSKDTTKTEITDKNVVNATIDTASAPQVIGQDSNYIYRLAQIKVAVTTTAGGTLTDKISKINGVSVGTPSSAPASVKVIQKISKAQATDTIDGAKYAKTVSDYEITDDAGVAVTPANTLDNNTKYSIVDGKIITYTNGKVQTIELKSKGVLNYTDLDSVNTDATGILDVDVNGNLWKLDGGYVYQFDNNDTWNKVYKVDGSMNQLSVYDKDNMVTWNEKDEVYSIVGNKETETPVVTPEVKTGWVKNADGTWSFVKADATKVTGWYNDNGTWYMLNSAGIMQTGWINDNGTWYYTNGSGAMQTGWQLVNGTWYYMQSSGAMKTGWLNDNGTWYYLNASGSMAVSTTVDGYKLGASGAWIK
ncbi:N-acetylmuramoyl-L-alanine amidase family protein [Clostridium uliginosum]|uniref:Putative cell wall binding repeat-containing protein n=1 Tax=Clostridium uliginosum TaxID=119641 RepID=A0A1I1QXF8_9CLOT|nr:N-acetylmuramoyl-L-alanine amidase family protein [Clostridium uliginosum]SFD26811.1 Putative cell wall binding repeat-containing protein [Clostridium uliginosum]